MTRVFNCRHIRAVAAVLPGRHGAAHPDRACKPRWFTSAVTPVHMYPKQTRTIVAHAWGDDVVFSEAKVVENSKAAAGMFIVKVDVGADIASGYVKGGQFIQMKVGDSKAAFLAIASSPEVSKSGVMEFLIKSVPGSTAEMIVGLGAGDQVSVSPVMGKGFPVETVPASEVGTMLIFATGSGISPIKALIEAGSLDATSRQDVRLYYGCSDADSTAYLNRIPEWEEAGVSVIKVFTAKGEGYVQDVYAKGEPLSNASDACVLLCGQKEMAMAVKEVLSAQGVPEDRFLTNF